MGDEGRRLADQPVALVEIDVGVYIGVLVPAPRKRAQRHPESKGLAWLDATVGLFNREGHIGPRRFGLVGRIGLSWQLVYLGGTRHRETDLMQYCGSTDRAIGDINRDVVAT